ncbi:hypothetical protein Poly41_65130 [Novipirellula artificiosorum]|uniref:Uncharacterized protein n=1 Tax=Novipirellula artificiosorum TaxID=2528016 RepID=A0A5C6D7F9_9BACT|nr:hypothetical protein Poly41_65130 [Novipirellula artificiosorum]
MIRTSKTIRSRALAHHATPLSSFCEGYLLATASSVGSCAEITGKSNGLKLNLEDREIIIELIGAA